MGCVTTMKIEDKKQLTKIISYLAMSDGSLHSNGGSKNCVFSMSLVAKHKDFLEYAKSIIENITSCNTYYQEREIPRQDLIKIQSLSHPFFTDLRDRIYVGTYKSIDIHALKLLDFEALAILYMCDGCLGKYVKSDGKASYSLTLNLCRLSYGDFMLLKKALKDKLDLEFNIVRTNRKYYTLRLRSKDLQKFMDGVTPYIFNSFLYKVDFRTVDSTEVDGDIV